MIYSLQLKYHWLQHNFFSTLVALFSLQWRHNELAGVSNHLTIVYSTIYSDADQRKHQSSASLAFVWGIQRDLRIPRTKGQLRGKCFHFMTSSSIHCNWNITDCNIIFAVIALFCIYDRTLGLLSGVPDLWDRNKIFSGGDLSHYQVPHCIRVFFILFDLCLFITIFNFISNYVLIVTFWIFTYHKIWILLSIYCFIWNYWIIYF